MGTEQHGLVGVETFIARVIYRGLELKIGPAIYLFPPKKNILSLVPQWPTVIERGVKHFVFACVGVCVSLSLSVCCEWSGRVAHSQEQNR